jgi:hypothetical protein
MDLLLLTQYCDTMAELRDDVAATRQRVVIASAMSMMNARVTVEALLPHHSYWCTCPKLCRN